MQTIPHIDVAEYDRIQALLDDPANYVWQAIDSEVLDGWVPDLGLTHYDNPSIYRPPSIANSGLASQLRHRFWRSGDNGRDHHGERYVGVLLYNALGEDSPMELRLASEDIGRIEPTRHDNHRHLIVADKRAMFVGGMEIFQFKAPGKGTYRIEAFLLLKERPAPSVFTPTIERLSVAAESATSATVHFVTSQVARCVAEALHKDDVVSSAQSDRPRTLHALRLDDLAPNQDYTIRVTATEKAGEVATAEINVSMRQPIHISKTVDVPLELINLSDADLSGMPLTFGVPLRQSEVFDGASCSVAGHAAQIRSNVHWPDGSAKWALLDATALEAFGPCAKLNALAIFSTNDITPNGLTWRDNDSHIEVTSEKLRLSIDLSSARIRLETQRDADWQTAINASVTGLFSAETVAHGLLRANGIAEGAIEDAGSQRVTVRLVVNHVDASDIARLRSTVWLHIYAGQAFIKLTHRLSIVDPHMPPAAGGDETATLFRLRSFALNLPWANQKAPQRIVHEHDLAHRVEDGAGAHRVEGRKAGHVTVRSAQGTLVVGVRRFWQTYPKGLAVNASNVTVELFPKLSVEPMPGDDEAWHRIYFWLKDGAYLLKNSMALTSDVLIGFPSDDADAQRMFAWLEQPPVVRPSIDYINSTHALHPIAPKANSPMPKYEALADEALPSFFADQEHVRAYGQVNYGDWYGESGWSWGNNEYDPAYCAYIEFLRVGDPNWATWGAQSARHLADVDTINQSSAPEQVGQQAPHMPGHMGGYLPPYFRSKIAGTGGIPSHTWVEGPLLHSLLTGDAVVRESVEKTKDWLLRDRWFDNYDFINCRESGWHLIHLCALAMGTNDPRCLNAASLIVRRVLEKEQPDGGWVHLLTESHCSCGYPRCRGEAGFMVGVLISGLKRYHSLTGDPRVAKAIVGGANWLIRETYDPSTGYFRYTSCKNRRTEEGFQKTQWVLEALADAYALSRDRDIGLVLQDSLSVVGMFAAGPATHQGLGKAMCMQMRYMPTVLALLNETQPTTTR